MNDTAAVVRVRIETMETYRTEASAARSPEG
jgi:hypothetical protein